MRMRASLNKTYKIRARTTTRDTEGNSVVTYAAGTDIKATVYPARGKLQAEMYGERLNYMLNMITDSIVTINEGDGVCVNSDSTPDYKVISIRTYTSHRNIELERL